LGDISVDNVHYSIGKRPVNIVSEVRDLGVIVDPALKFNSHINYIVAKANTCASIIHKCFLSHNPNVMLRAFKIYVRPLLEYATSDWSRYFSYAIVKIESSQRKFTKRLKGCKYMDCPTRLSFLNLPSLERRRLTADLILTYKIIFGLLDIRMEDYFQLQSTDDYRTITRGNPYKLLVNYCQTNVQKMSLANVL